jgi:hypothetical protein
MLRPPVVFLIVLIFVGWSSAKADSRVTIQGRVVYEPTRKPLKNVTMKLLRPDHSLLTVLKTAGKAGVPEVFGITKTDSKGDFSFETTRPGPYEIECQRPGRHFGSGMLNVDPKKFVLIQYKADPIPFTLRPGEKPPSR